MTLIYYLVVVAVVVALMELPVQQVHLAHLVLSVHLAHLVLRVESEQRAPKELLVFPVHLGPKVPLVFKVLLVHKVLQVLVLLSEVRHKVNPNLMVHHQAMHGLMKMIPNCYMSGPMMVMAPNNG